MSANETALANVPAKRIVRAIASAAERWSDADFPPRVRVTDRIAERTGYSVPVIEYALDRLFFSITGEALEAAIDGELGSLGTLDDFVLQPGRPAALAAPAGRVCIISSRTTIGVALTPAVFALCAKCDVLVKDREDALVAAFFDTLGEELDEFESAARAQVWNSDDESAPRVSAFDAVAVFGSDATIAAVASACKPGARILGYGSRASAGYVTRESLRDRHYLEAIAEGAARDIVLYETEGCLSLHVLFIESGDSGGTDAAGFAALLSRELERAGVEFPQGRIAPSTAAKVGEHHRLAAFRAAGGRGAVFASPGEYALIVDPPKAEPPAFLPRTIGMHAVDGPPQALEYLRAHNIPLEAFALSAPRSDALEMALAAGAVRIARFGELQTPPLAGHHGGRPRIADFVKWIDRAL